MHLVLKLACAVLVLVGVMTAFFGAGIYFGWFEPAPAPSPEMQKLLTAARRGDLEEVQRALAAGANVNTQDGRSGDTALIRAAAFGHAGLVKALLAAGATPATKNTKNETALHDAASQGYTDIVALLLAAKAPLADDGDPDRRPASPLERSVEHLDIATTHVLLAAGANAKPVRLAWVVANALGNGRGELTAPQIVQDLVRAGAELDRGFGGYETALFAAAMNCHHPGSAAVARILVAAGASTTARNGEGLTPRGATEAQARHSQGDFRTRCEQMLKVLPR